MTITALPNTQINTTKPQTASLQIKSLNLIDAINKKDLQGFHAYLALDGGQAERKSAIYYAAEQNSPIFLKILLSGSISRETTGTALRFAAREGSLSCLNELLKNDISQNDYDEALSRAAHFGHLPCIKALFDKITFKNEEIEIAIRAAGFHQHFDCIAFLREKQSEGCCVIP